MLKDDASLIVFQVNGKIRDKKEFPLGADESEIESFAFSSAKINSYIENKTIIKKIYVKNKLYSIVVN